MAFQMTLNTFGMRQKFNTVYFREAIQYYLMYIHGLKSDDFDYPGINKIFKKEFKIYLKKCCCSPDKVCVEDYEQMYFSLTV